MIRKGTFCRLEMFCEADMHCSVTHDFTANGLKHANRLLGYDAFCLDDWDAVGEYDEKGGKHQAFVVPNKDVIVEGVAVKRGEKVRIEESYKYSRAQAEDLWHDANVMQIRTWSNDAEDYGISSRILSDCGRKRPADLSLSVAYAQTHHNVSDEAGGVCGASSAQLG